MRYKVKSIAALQLALGGLPNEMPVQVDADVAVSARTVGELPQETILRALEAISHDRHSKKEETYSAEN